MAASRASAAADEEGAPTPADRARMAKAAAAGQWYELLGLGAQNVNATEDEVRRAHRRLILHYHPDKAKGAAESEAKLVAGGGMPAAGSDAARASSDACKAQPIIPWRWSFPKGSI